MTNAGCAHIRGKVTQSHPGEWRWEVRSRDRAVAWGEEFRYAFAVEAAHDATNALRGAWGWMRPTPKKLR